MSQYQDHNSPSTAQSGESEARHLYEVRGDTVASLHAYGSSSTQNYTDANSQKQGNGVSADKGSKTNQEKSDKSKDATTTNNDNPARVHNQLLLSYLSSCFKGGNNPPATASTSSSKNDGSKDVNFLQHLEQQFAKALEEAQQPMSPQTELKKEKKEQEQEGSKKEEEDIKEKPSISLLRRPSMTLLILGHNLALSYLIQNNPTRGIQILSPLFQTFSKPISTTKSATGDNDTDKHQQEEENEDFATADSQCKVAFLLLDCILASRQVQQTDDVLNWIEKEYIANYPSTFAKYAQEQQHSTNPVTTSQKPESLTELKFRLNCYKSRTLFLRSKFEEQRKRDANTRLARKELKSAMEIYHHKLSTKKTSSSTKNGRCESMDGGGSVQESVGSGQSNNNDHNTTTTTTNTTSNSSITTNTTTNTVEAYNLVSPPKSVFQSKKLDIQNQCALYLKANLEYLKGNTKKSLKLCSEAQNIKDRERSMMLSMSSNSGNDEHQQQQHDQEVTKGHNSKHSSDLNYAMHYNNLGIIHQASGKVHIAMHYYAKALRHMENVESNTTEEVEDGVAHPLPTCELLYNTALCAQQASNFSSAYECMARCIGASPTLFAKNPLCWMHLGESCIGAHSNLKREGRQSGQTRTSSSMPRSFPVPSPVVENGAIPHQPEPATNSNYSSDISNIDNLEIFLDEPLARAIDCLHQCIHLCDEKSSQPNTISADIYARWKESASVALAYVWMEFNNPASVVSLADKVLEAPPFKPMEEGDEIGECLISRRRRATMKLYACEAFCRLGDPMKALEYIVEDKSILSKDNDTLTDEDCRSIETKLALELAMLEEEKVESFQPWERQRYLDAKASVRIALAGTFLSAGNVNTAKRLTQSVPFSEGLPSPNSAAGERQPSSSHDSDVSLQNAMRNYLIKERKLQEAVDM